MSDSGDIKPGDFGSIRNTAGDRRDAYERNRYASGEIVAVLINDTNKRIQWDVRQCGVDRVWFMPHSRVGVTALQSEIIKRKPAGISVKSYDPSDPKNRKLIRVGE